MPTFNPMLARQIIMDHYEYPRNKKLIDEDGYQKIHMHSDSCIDDFEIQVKVENNVIKDVRFDGVGCTISTASTSVMTELLMNKTIKEANEIIENYFKMIHEEPYDEDLLEEANAFKNTSKQASRIRCATIGWNGVNEIINKVK
ncbi:TPA: SUF system NifU family Fe-S cluster assembly protein [bacterium]|jgi:nitrogen fixation NifU-like protein|nr:SUF system NifU family Fe-S cluster assembly protein [bacterium]